jgi:mono/diheme cytochrome c family protein
LFTVVVKKKTKLPIQTGKLPADASEKQMPFENTAIAAQKGKELYNVYCWSCHGTTGHGDGAAGGALGQKPANLHERRVKNQSDGAIFWKISTGKGNMPPFQRCYD